MNYLKKLILLSGLFWSFTFHMNAQQRFAVGINFNQTLSSYGMGLNISTPLISKSFQIRLSANVMGLSGVRALSNRTTLEGYELFRLGIVGKGTNIADKARIYWEGGPLMILNNPTVTDKKFNIGGYGVFGMEYLMFKKTAVFLEGGGIGTGAQAEKFVGKPSFATGLFFGTGLRFYL